MNVGGYECHYHNNGVIPVKRPRWRKKLLVCRAHSSLQANYHTESVSLRFFSPKGVVERLGLVSGVGLASISSNAEFSMKDRRSSVCGCTKSTICRPRGFPRANYHTESASLRFYSPKGVVERLGLVSGVGLASISSNAELAQGQSSSQSENDGMDCQINKVVY